MFKIFTNAWKVSDIRKKILYVILLLIVYRLGTHIPLPGVDPSQISSSVDANNLISLFLGGNTGTLFAMNIGPYITASIIMQLLTVAIPKLEQIQKDGEEGRKKINQFTRYLAVGLSFLQASATVYSYSGSGLFYSKNENMFVYIIAAVAMTTGTIFIMWLAELLSEKGIGNGSSFIITANILSGLPVGLYSLYQMALGGFTDMLKVAALLIAFAGVIAFVVLIQGGERRIPVQYSRKMTGKQVFGGQSSYIPIKVNIAGVMSIIFAISLISFPATISGFFPNNELLKSISSAVNYHKPLGATIYVVLIFMFTFFYISFAMNPVEMAENMKKNGGFVPGIRPGKPTSDYIQRTVDRLSWFGALCYAAIALVPIILGMALDMTNVGFGGTTLLIVTGVALELVKQLESQLLMRHYKGFLN